MADTLNIRLNDLRFYSRIGVADQERLVGNEFSVTVAINIDASSFIPENLSTSVSYADIYQIIEQEMNKTWLLLESVAKSIAEILFDRWHSIQECSVNVTKLSVPLKGIGGSASVEYCKKR